MGPGSILQEKGHSQLEDITAENGAWPHLFYGPIYSQSFALLCLFKRLPRRFAPLNALSAFLTVFSPYSHRQAGNPTKSGGEGVRPYPEECHKSKQ